MFSISKRSELASLSRLLWSSLYIDEICLLIMLCPGLTGMASQVRTESFLSSLVATSSWGWSPLDVVVLDPNTSNDIRPGSSWSRSIILLSFAVVVLLRIGKANWSSDLFDDLSNVGSSWWWWWSWAWWWSDLGSRFFSIFSWSSWSTWTDFSSDHPVQPRVAKIFLP